MSKELTPKQQQFCLEYIVDLNATQAAIRAGYSERTAKSQGQRLLTNVDIASRVQILKNQKQTKTGVNAERTLHELGSLAFSKITDVLSWSEEGGVKVKDSKDISPETAAAISEMKIRVIETDVKQYVNEEGVEVRESNKQTFYEVKMHKKDPSLNVLSQHTGLLNREDDTGDADLNDALAALEQEDSEN